MKQQAPTQETTAVPAPQSDAGATAQSGSGAGNAAAVDQMGAAPPEQPELLPWFQREIAVDDAGSAPAEPGSGVASAPSGEPGPAAPDGSLLLMGDAGAVEVIAVSPTTVEAWSGPVTDAVPAAASGPTTTTTAVNEPGKSVTETSTEEKVLASTDEGVVEQTEVTYKRSTLDIAGGKFTYTIGTDTKTLEELDAKAKEAAVVTELDSRSSAFERDMAADATRRAELEELRGAPADVETSPDDHAAAIADYEAEIAAIDARTIANEEAQDALHRSAMDLAMSETDMVEVTELAEELGVDQTKEVKDGESQTVELGLDGVKFARESHAADESSEEQSVQISAGGVTVTQATTDADGNSTETEGGIDLSEGVGADVKHSTESEDGSSTEATGSVDIVYDEEKGLQGLKGEGGLEVTDKNGTSKKVEVRGTMTTEEVGGGITVGGGGQAGSKDDEGELKNGGTFDVSIGGDAGIKATVEVLGADQYKLTVTVYGKLALAGSVGAQGSTEAAGKGSAEVEVGAGASEELTFVHVMTKAEAESYFGELEKGTSGEEPEFGWVGKLRALAANGEMAWDDPAVAAQMQDGESYSEKGTIDAKFGVSAGWGWVKGSVSYSGSAAWTRSVSRKGATTTVSNGLATTLSVGAGGELIVGGVTGSVEVKSTTTVGATASGPVDLATEAGQAAFRAVLEAPDVDALIAAGESAGMSMAYQNGESLVTETGVKVGGVGIVGTETSTTDETVTEGPDGLEADVSGSSGEGLEIVAGDTAVAGETETDKADLKVDDEGIEGEFSEETETVGPGGEGSSAGEAAADLFAGGVPQVLKDALLGEEKRISSYKVSKADMATVLATRVPDENNWQKACVTARIFNSWLDLRWYLENPVPDPKYVDEYPAEATWLSQARSIADFMAHSDADGFECWENVLRHWGEVGGNDAGGADGVDLGERTEWPPGTEDIQKAWDDATARVTALPALLKEALAAMPADTSDVDAHCQDLVDDLDEVSYQLLVRDDFQSPAARSEMVARVDAQGRSVKAAWADFLSQADSLGQSAPDEEQEVFDPEESECDESTPEQSEEEPGESHDTFALEEDQMLRDDLSDHLATLRANKFAEEGLVEDMVNAWSWEEMVDLQRHLDELWELWVDQVIETRGLYMALLAPFEDFKVSFDSTEPRSATYEPDVRPAIAFWVEEGNGHSDRGALERQYARFVNY